MIFSSKNRKAAKHRAKNGLKPQNPKPRMSLKCRLLLVGNKSNSSQKVSKIVTLESGMNPPPAYSTTPTV